jgi:hypothetical protein
MTLPQFCLSFIESRWVWAGFRPPLPARNARWSFTRVIIFTLGQTLVGAALGAAVALLFSGLFGGFATWLIWLAAGFSACQGVSYSLTALCWNQRAARLQANPALDVSLPPTRYPVFRFLLEIVYFVLLALITPAAIFLTVENLRGEILWRCERAKLVAQGERLEFRELLGPAIPPDQNAGAAAIFAPFFDYHLERVQTPQSDAPGEYWEQDQAVWHDTNALHRLVERLGFPDSHWPRDDRPSSSKPHTPKINLAAWAEAYRSLLTDPKKNDPSWVAELKLPPSTNDPARVVLAGLSVADRELAALCEASARPRSQFPVHYEEGFNCQLRQHGVFKGASLLLQRRCAAHLEIGETEAAFNDAECALRVAELLREEPLLISQLVRMAQGAITTRTIWQGLAEHRWSDAQLAAFQERLAKVDYMSGAAFAFEGERAAGIQAINNLISRPGGDIPSVARPIVRGMLRQNQIALVRHQSQQITKIRAALSNAPQSGLAAVTTAASKGGQLKERSPYNTFVWMMAPATDRAVARAVRAHTINRMAVVACALERYHLKHHVFPEKLDDLAPTFLPTTPLDPMNNQPFCYQRTDDGWFRLYSVGADGKDDGGVLKPEKNKPEKDWPWPVPTRPEKSLLF